MPNLLTDVISVRAIDFIKYEQAILMQENAPAMAIARITAEGIDVPATRRAVKCQPRF
jgi:hypothetical protein